MLRIHPNIKRCICKRCEAQLVPGVSCTLESENKSRGGRKAWAEVVVVRCRGCGGVKRFPVGRGGKGKGKEKEEGKGDREGEGEAEAAGYKLWCDREGVLEGEVIGGGGAGGMVGQAGN